MNPMIIAIDGPAASGKGSLARALAKHLGYAHLDTGALYRAVGYTLLQEGADPDNEALAVSHAKSLIIGPGDLDNPALRTDEAGQAASKVAKFPGVRDALFDFQRAFAANPPGGSGAVLDGRDIGTVICPDAQVKLFITASVEERANRRLKELHGRGMAATYEDVLADMKERDARDSGREAAPLKPAPDAHIIDTTALTPGEAMARALSIIQNA
jgi:CMP/dCMP kinase